MSIAQSSWARSLARRTAALGLTSIVLTARATMALIPTPTAPATPTCAATGTPYCTTHCMPCPTIRAGCLARACGRCFESPVCGETPAEGFCRCITPTPGAPPTPTPTAPATPICAPTGTPYCSVQCMPCPTIREGCLARPCGNCFESPVCGETHAEGPCPCITPTPGVPPAPTPTAGVTISGLVYDASIGRNAPIADAEVAYTYGSNGGGGSVHTDAAGRYRFELPPDVTAFGLVVAADGFFVWQAGYVIADLGRTLDIGLDPDGCASTSAISIAPTMGPVGTAVHVSGQCYFIHSGREATIDFDLDAVATVRGDTEGAYQTTFTVPATASDGSHLVSLRAGNSQYGAVTFSVVSLCGGACTCSGDCDGDGAVRVNELIRMVNVALNGDTDTGACPQIARWCRDVDIGCLVEAVNHALQGCPAEAGV